jgi:hypothetical protein
MPGLVFQVVEDRAVLVVPEDVFEVCEAIFSLCRGCGSDSI